MATSRQHQPHEPHPQVLIVSPVRNEAVHIARVVRGVAAQQPAPAAWMAIDDGSSDDTYDQLHAFSGELDCLTVLRAPAQAPGARDRLARAVEARNFNLALAHAGWEDGACAAENGDLALAHAGWEDDARAPWRGDLGSGTRRGAYTHVMKLDGDIELPPGYLAGLLERFAANPRLGIAGGTLVEPTPDGGERPIRIARHHVHGALKCYTRECFSAIGGVPERLGWDTIDETYARMRGFQTQSFTELQCVHHRPLASADGALRGHARHGECAYVTHQAALWVALRSLRVARRPPAGVSGAAFLYGYAHAAVRRTERVADREYRSFTRRELRGRMREALR
jgi:biofilm PGA synthesis N-glycosyltransferase PgaC